MRVLITIKPQMYRETLALALHKHRPDAEVMLAPASYLDDQIDGFEPDLLVRNDNDGLSPDYLNTIAFRIEILLTDGMGARINLGGQVRKIEDMSVDDLLSVLDEVEELLSGEPAG